MQELLPRGFVHNGRPPGRSASRMSFLLIVVALLQDRYVVDPTSSWFSAKVEVGGVLSMFGHEHTVALRELSGEARFDPAAIEEASLRMTIRAASAVEVGQEFSEEDRKEIWRKGERRYKRRLQTMGWRRFPHLNMYSSQAYLTRYFHCAYYVSKRFSGKTVIIGWATLLLYPK